MDIMYGGCKLLNTTDMDAVIITVNGRKIYSGGFPIPSFSSRSPAEVIISDYDVSSLIIINHGKIDDLRQDKRIYDFFKKNGKLTE